MPSGRCFGRASPGSVGGALDAGTCARLGSPAARAGSDMISRTSLELIVVDQSDTRSVATRRLVVT